MAKHRAKSGRAKPGRGVKRRAKSRRSKPGRGVWQVVSPLALSTAALATAVSVGGVATTTPGSVASSPVELSALVVAGSSTNPTGDGIREFYRGKFDRPDEDVTTVNFLTGPLGIYKALHDNRNDDNNVVLSSGWGAANASALLTYLGATGSSDPALAKSKLFVLDNNVASPNGGFGTRYPGFALLGVNPFPTPTAPGVSVVNVVYEYDLNSNAPAYVLNGAATANSLIAYVQNRQNQADQVLPVDEHGNPLLPATCGDSCSVSTSQDGRIDFTRVEDGRYGFSTEAGDSGFIETVGDTAYVSYQSDGLPLVAPLRLLGEPGDRIADMIEPALRTIVDFGYPGDDPLANPDQYIPARLIPRPNETGQFIHDFVAGVEEGLARHDSSPSGGTGVSATEEAPQHADSNETSADGGETSAAVRGPAEGDKRFSPVKKSPSLTSSLQHADSDETSADGGETSAAVRGPAERGKRFSLVRRSPNFTPSQQRADSGESSPAAGGPVDGKKRFSPLNRKSRNFTPPKQQRTSVNASLHRPGKPTVKHSQRAHGSRHHRDGGK